MQGRERNTIVRCGLVIVLIFCVLIPSAYARRLSPLTDPYLVKSFREGYGPQLPDAVVSLYVLRNDYPLRGVTVTVCSPEGEPVVQYGAKQTDPAGRVSFMLPRNKQFTLRLQYDAISFRFDKYTDIFRPPNNIMYETNRNQKPQITGIETQEVLEGTEVFMSFSVRDPDGNELMITPKEKWPEWVTMHVDTHGQGTVSMRPGYDDAGLYSFTILAQERGKEPADAAAPTHDTLLSTEATFMVSVLNAIRPPEIAQVPEQMMSEGEHRVIEVSIRDDDVNDLLNGLEVVELPSFAVLEGTTITCAPGYDDAGEYRVVLRARDFIDHEAMSEMSFVIRVVETKRVPMVHVVDSVTLKEGEEFSIGIAAVDPDNEAAEMDVAVKYLPRFASFEGDTITFRPGYGDTGIYDMFVVVSKKSGTELLKSEKNVHITVQDVRQPVKITEIPDQKVTEGEMLIVDVNVFDPEARSRGVQVAIEGLPSFGVYEQDRLVFRPGFDDAELYAITVTAFSKGFEDVVSRETFWLEVEAAGRYAVAGRITGADGRGLKDVSMRVDKRVVYTDSEGYFELDHVLEGTYMFEPRRAGYVFEPERREVTIIDAGMAACDFQGQAAAYVKITKPDAGVYVKGTTLRSVMGVGSVYLPDRVEVNGVEAFFDFDIMESSNNNYSFIVDDVPLEFGEDHTAFVEAIAYDENGHVRARTKILVRKSE